MTVGTPDQDGTDAADTRTPDAVRHRMGRFKAQFSRVWISERDFDEVARFVDQLHGQHSQDLQRAVLVAAVISYARPFTENGTGKNKESIASLPVNLVDALAPAQLDLHRKMLDLRNEAVAHSDYARRAAQWSFGQDNGYMTASKLFDILGEVPVPADLKELALVMKAWCNHKLRALNFKLIECRQELGEFERLDR